MRFHCYGCGKFVSSEVPEDAILRAVAWCPECCEAGKDQDPELVAKLAEARKDRERLDWFERQWGVRRDPLIPARAFTFTYLDGTSRAGFQPLRYEIDAAMEGEGQGGDTSI